MAGRLRGGVRMKIGVVSGAIANKYRNGGAVWTRLNWVLGLQKLGLRAYFIEQIDRTSCVDAAGAVVPFRQSVNLASFREVVARFGLSGSAALVYDNGADVDGMTWD